MLQHEARGTSASVQRELTGRENKDRGHSQPYMPRCGVHCLSAHTYFFVEPVAVCTQLANISPSVGPNISFFPSITCFRRKFLRKIWPIQLAFRFLISCRIFLCSLTLSNTSSFLKWSVQLIFSILLQHHISKLKKMVTLTIQLYLVPRLMCGVLSPLQHILLRN